VSCVRGHDTYSAYWVGLGGFSPGSQALEQIGTEADCDISGHASISVWYEMVPAASMPISMSVVSGDQIDARVAVTGHRATLVLRDVTRHERFHITVSSQQIDVSSAEWIVEAPSDCITSCLTLPLADFGTAAFTSARVQAVGGHSGTIADSTWTSTRIRLSPTGAHFTTVHAGARTTGAALPSSLAGGGSAFSVSFTEIPAGTGGFAVKRSHIRRAGHILHPPLRGAR
jgi:hypothetical protein